MDHKLGWWAHAVFEGWRDRPGPRYQRLAAALLDAVDEGRVPSGARLPAERHLSDALGVSRGTVVAAFDQLSQAGVVRRRQGAGTFVVGRPGWLRQRAENPSAALLLRRLAGRESLDLSLSVPPGTDHLPDVDWSLGAAPSGHGLEPAGLEGLRERVAAHLTHHQQLPTQPDQLVITSGAQQALAVVAGLVSAGRTSAVAGCPTYPGLRSAFAGRGARIVPVPADAAAGVDPEGLARAARRADNPIVYVMPTGSNPTGAVMPATRRAAVLDAARAAGALVVEDLSLADLVYDGAVPPPPLSSLDPDVVAIGSLGKLFWAGLRIGWIRAGEPLRSSVVRTKAALDLATATPSQQIAERLLAAVDARWIEHLRAGLAARRDRLAQRLAERLPSWTVGAPPAAGLSLWVRLPVAEADSFCHLAAQHGVVVAPGSVACVCGRHAPYVRISFAHTIDELDLAVDRLSWAWAAHSEDLAATPTPA